MKHTGNSGVHVEHEPFEVYESKTVLSLSYTEESPGYPMYIHDSKSLFNNSADLYQLRHFFAAWLF